MQDNIVLLSFEQTSKAYQALAELKQAAAEGRVQVIAAAVVERHADGRLQLKDGYGNGAVANAPLVGSMLGGLLGVLGGPLGVLMLGTTGALLGSMASADALGTRLSLVEQITRAVPPGATALFAHVEEAAVEVVDGLAKELDAVVLRRPTDAVYAEVQAAAEAQDAAAQQARQVLRDKQRAEWKEKLEAWSSEVQEHWHQLTDKIKARLDGKP
ncbi:hypothetical protein [Ottowia sp.]|uniref:hypothetical protein n=1 Tax=Ottowia sp. TaxID=1898956 RepID=UPI003A8759A6